MCSAATSPSSTMLQRLQQLAAEEARAPPVIGQRGERADHRRTRRRPAAVAALDAPQRHDEARLARHSRPRPGRAARGARDTAARPRSIRLRGQHALIVLLEGEPALGLAAVELDHPRDRRHAGRAPRPGSRRSMPWRQARPGAAVEPGVERLGLGQRRQRQQAPDQGDDRAPAAPVRSRLQRHDGSAPIFAAPAAWPTVGSIIHGKGPNKQDLCGFALLLMGDSTIRLCLPPSAPIRHLAEQAGAIDRLGDVVVHAGRAGSAGRRRPWRWR